MTFGGLHFNHRFAAQHAILDTADFISHHAALKQQVTRGGAHLINRDRGIMLAFSRSGSGACASALVNILHRLNRLGEQLAIVVRDHFRA